MYGYKNTLDICYRSTGIKWEQGKYKKVKNIHHNNRPVNKRVDEKYGAGRASPWVNDYYYILHSGLPLHFTKCEKWWQWASTVYAVECHCIWSITNIPASVGLLLGIYPWCSCYLLWYSSCIFPILDPRMAVNNICDWPGFRGFCYILPYFESWPSHKSRNHTPFTAPNNIWYMEKTK